MAVAIRFGMIQCVFGGFSVLVHGLVCPPQVLFVLGDDEGRDVARVAQTLIRPLDEDLAMPLT